MRPLRNRWLSPVLMVAAMVATMICTSGPPDVNQLGNYADYRPDPGAESSAVYEAAAMQPMTLDAAILEVMRDGQLQVASPEVIREAIDATSPAVMRAHTPEPSPDLVKTDSAPPPTFGVDRRRLIQCRARSPSSAMTG